VLGAVDKLNVDMFEVFGRGAMNRWPWYRIGTTQCANGHEGGAGQDGLIRLDALSCAAISFPNLT